MVVNRGVQRVGTIGDVMSEQSRVVDDALLDPATGLAVRRRAPLTKCDP